MRLWIPKNNIPNFEITKSDETAILKEFFLKQTTKSSSFNLDSSKRDSMLNKEYSFESFNLYDFINTESCIESLRCTRLRIQLLELLEYSKNEYKIIEDLINEYKKDYLDKDCLDNKLILKELIKKKTQNVKMIEEIRGNIVEIIKKGEEAAKSLERMRKILNK